MPSDIEFVDADPPAPDGVVEDVATPAPRRSPIHTVALIGAAVVALVVAGVTVQHHGRQHSAASPAPGPATALAKVPERPRVAFHVTRGLPDWLSVPMTFGVDSARSTTIDGTPSGVREAVRSALPGWRIVETQTVSTRLIVPGARRPLRFDLGDADVQARLITLRSGGAQVLVRIVRRTTPKDEPPQSIRPGGAGQRSDFLRLETAGYVIDVQWIGAQSLSSPVDGMTLLINDPNLLATS